MKLSHKIEIKPNKTQEEYLAKACGVARFTYNWALGRSIEAYKAQEKLKRNELKREFNQIKYTEFPFVNEVTKCASEQALSDVNTAYQRFFKKKAKFPRFKKKGKKESFYISNDKFRLENQKVRIPKLGWVRLTEELRFKGKILSAVLSRTAHKWFISITVELDVSQPPKACENQEAIGVDLGIKSLATLSNGETYAGPKPLKKNLKKLQRTSRQFSRKVKGSNNRDKARKRLARIHYHIACIRKDYLDKLTTYLCQNFKTICIEDLATSNMLKNKKLSRAISDMSWYEFRRQLQYKSQLYDNKLIVINRHEPTSKRCSGCGSIKTLTLADRTYCCENCGLVIARDLNAAINICTVGLTGSYACGDGSSGLDASDLSETTVVEAGTKNLVSPLATGDFSKF